ncbi:MAG: glycosyltransferase family 4 protein [Candidatus Woesearchaeota archaeon]
MKVLMLGWEFPPYHSGGLGIACYGLTKGLAHQGVEVTFVLPTLKEDIKAEFVRIIGANRGNITIQSIKSPLSEYMTTRSYAEIMSKKATDSTPRLYGPDLFTEVYRFAKRVEQIAKTEKFDVIHAHDWLTYQAGIYAKKVSGKPLVVHVHATEFDRTANNHVNQLVYDIERTGMHAADSIIAVSNFTKSKIVNKYGINPEKVNVVHNGCELKHHKISKEFAIKKTDKVVLFLGRITFQKGPEYFLYMAQKVLEHIPNVKFVIAGSGDMDQFIITKAAQMGLGKHVLFTGFLRGADIDRAYTMADVYVMPSVSEPFGITPLEAMMHQTPVIISKQSGVSEVVSHCLKVDFWDIEELANKVVSILRYPSLAATLTDNADLELPNFDWDIPARKCVEVYKTLEEKW